VLVGSSRRSAIGTRLIWLHTCSYNSRTFMDFCILKEEIDHSRVLEGERLEYVSDADIQRLSRRAISSQSKTRSSSEASRDARCATASGKVDVCEVRSNWCAIVSSQFRKGPTCPACFRNKHGFAPRELCEGESGDLNGHASRCEVMKWTADRK
jgi:hypothetical protein